MLIFIVLNFFLIFSTIAVPAPEFITSNSLHDVEIDKFSFPAEAINPSEFEIAKKFNEGDERHERISSVYENEIQYSKSFLKESQNGNMRNGLIDERKRWPKIGDYVYIPYIISSKFDQRQRQIIAKAFDNFHDNTCIRFIPRINQVDYVHIYQGVGCDSDAGRTGGEQTLSLGPGCDYTDTAIHELNHAVGFWHEQNRPDRDKYVVVHLENVKPENRFNFDKMSPRQVNFYGVEYDTNSIMHYDRVAFSKDPKRLPVIEPKIPNPNMGLAKTLSKSDILRIQKMYKCDSKNRKSRLNWESGTSFEVDEEDDGSEMNTDTINLKDECGDFHSNCTYFRNEKSESSSNCVINAWVRVTCRKSCNTCSNPCQDIKEECEDWSNSGSCELYNEYMKIYCPKSCKMC